MQVEDLGDAVKAIKHGFQKNEIERNAYRIAQESDKGERVFVGVNRLQLDEEEPSEPLRVDPAIEQQQAERLAKLRAWRCDERLDTALMAMRKAAEGEDNVLNEGGPRRRRDRRRGPQRAARDMGHLQPP